MLSFNDCLVQKIPLFSYNLTYFIINKLNLISEIVQCESLF